ncbi:MAG: hypothetical protein QXZ63_06705 [Sulfolobales archaeon]
MNTWWLKFILWPTFPSQVLEVVYQDRHETYYSEVDDIRVYSSDKGYVVTVIPGSGRRDAPGPISFVSSHDPWSVGVFVTPFYYFRKEVTTWMMVWFSVIYFLLFYYLIVVSMPPTIEVYVPYFGRNVTVPDPFWRLDPVVNSYWILAIGFLVMYYVFHMLRSVTPSVKYASLLVVGSVSGVSYAVPSPYPLTALRTSDFLRMLGHKIRNFELETVHTLMGALTSIMRENKALREQALSYDDAMSRVTQIDVMLKRFSATQVVARFATTKPLLFMLLITIPLLVGVLIGMALSGGVSVEPLSTPATP